MSSGAHVLLVDDDEDLLRLLRLRLRRAGHVVDAASSGSAALEILDRLRPDVVVTDLKMQGMDGIALLKQIERRAPMMPVILLTAHGSIPDAVEATQSGAFAFLSKPIDDADLLACIDEARGLCAVQGSVASSEAAWRRDILTRSPIMETLLEQARLAAASDASIMILGPSGTGKELLARAVHAASKRHAHAFVPVNSAAIPESLFESEMFGHVKGAFTGAHHNRAGQFQRAHGGTLFLDEVGDLPRAFQPKLLRALESGVIRAVGSDADVNVDVRVISATNRNIEAALSEESFREDLYYRLNVVTLELPALSERREDIPLLAQHFLAQHPNGIATSFSRAALRRLVAAPWPGNVRQLANVVLQCAVLCRSRVIPETLVDRALHARVDEPEPLATARDRFERQYLSKLMRATLGNVSQAARVAGRNRSEFYKLLKRHSLDPATFRDDSH